MSDMNTARKSKFESAVFAEAQLQKDLIIEKAKITKDETLEKVETDILSELYSTMQNEVKNITTVLRSEFAKSKIDNRREMLLKREELKETLFNNVKKRLIAYIQTDEYKQKIVQKISELVNNNKLTGITLKINTSDENLLNEIISVLDENSTISQDRGITLGGFIIFDAINNIVYDESYDNRILDEEEQFCSYSGMNI